MPTRVVCTGSTSKGETCNTDSNTDSNTTNTTNALNGRQPILWMNQEHHVLTKHSERAHS
jgi:hypothetical protein